MLQRKVSKDMAIKKSELYSSLWKSCDELRGGMDASQYKDYVLVLLFVKYVSDKYAGQKGALIEVPQGGGFADMVALKGDKEIGDKLNKIIGRLADANDLKGVIDVADFNDPDKLGKGKDMVDRLSNLITIFNDPKLNFRSNRSDGDDILGDAYEYLMRHFATESGKSKGQFYTPAEVSRIMAQVIGLGKATSAKQTIYDPTCGSGALLLKAHDEAKSATGLDLALYGQEKDNATAALAKMNMILHDCPTAEIWRDNVLSSPHWKGVSSGLKTFDYVVANPPFSTKSWSNGLDPAHDEFGRFTFGVPPEKNGDYAFLLHLLTSMKSTGKGAIILPHGVLFRGHAEANIRKRILKQGYIKGIIGLPANLFYGTGIPACILVLDKEGAATRKGVYMIDASKGFIKDGNKNRLRSQDIHRIVDTFSKQSDVDKYARFVPFDEIEANDFNLNIPRYIDSSEPEDLQDIEAHLCGGIPSQDVDSLANYWDVLPSLRQELFTDGDRPGYLNVRLEANQVRTAIQEHSEFKTFTGRAHGLFAQWKNQAYPLMTALQPGQHPKQFIGTISEALLETFRKLPLIDPYDVYQHLMNYWSETMQDDVYMLTTGSWKEVARVKQVLDKEDKSKTDLAIDKKKYRTELIPPQLIIAKYFAHAQQKAVQLESEKEQLARELEELQEEHGGDEGLLSDATTDKDKLTKGSIKARLVEIKNDPNSADERELLEQCLDLMAKEASLAKALKEAEKELSTQVLEKYKQLSEEEIKQLIIEDKWLATLHECVQEELDRVTQGLTGRVKELAERYQSPLPVIEQQVTECQRRVEEHLKQMGFDWTPLAAAGRT
jgi:type I restriction enzyme M protein